MILLWVVCLLVLGSPPIWSCDGKYLVCYAGAAPYVVTSSPVPSTIVFYAPAGTPSTDWLLSNCFDEALARAGHRVFLVRTQVELAEVLECEHADLIVADWKLLDLPPAGAPAPARHRPFRQELLARTRERIR